MIYLGYSYDPSGDSVVFDELRVIDRASTIAELDTMNSEVKSIRGNILFSQSFRTENWHGSDITDTRNSIFSSNDELIKFNSDLNTMNHGALSFTTTDTGVTFMEGATDIVGDTSDKSIRMSNIQSLSGLSGYNPSSVADGFHFSLWYLAENNSDNAPTVLAGFGADANADRGDINFEIDTKNSFFKVTDVNGNSIVSVNTSASNTWNWHLATFNYINGIAYFYFDGVMIWSGAMSDNPITRDGLILNKPLYDPLTGIAMNVRMDQLRIGKGLSPILIESLNTETTSERMEQVQNAEAFHVPAEGEQSQAQSVADLDSGIFAQSQDLPEEMAGYGFTQKSNINTFSKELFEQLETISSDVLGKHLFSQANQVAYYNPIVDVKDVRQPHDDYVPGYYETQLLASFDGVIDLAIGGDYTLGEGKRGSLGLVPDPGGNTALTKSGYNARCGLVAIWVHLVNSDFDKTLVSIASNSAGWQVQMLITADGRLKIEYLGLNYLSEPYEWHNIDLQIILNTDHEKGEQRIKLNGRKVVSRTAYSALQSFYGSTIIGKDSNFQQVGIHGNYDSFRLLAYGASEAQEIIIEKDEVSDGIGFTTIETMFPYSKKVFSQKSSIEEAGAYVFVQKQSTYTGAGVMFVQSQSIYVFRAILSFTQVQSIDEPSETVILRRVN